MSFNSVVAFVFGIVFSFTFVFVFGIVFSFVFVFVFQQGGAMARPGSASPATEQFMATVYSKLLATNNGHQPDSVDNKTSQLRPLLIFVAKFRSLSAAIALAFFKHVLSTTNILFTCWFLSDPYRSDPEEANLSLSLLSVRLLGPTANSVKLFTSEALQTHMTIIFRKLMTCISNYPMTPP